MCGFLVRCGVALALLITVAVQGRAQESATGQFLERRIPTLMQTADIPGLSAALVEGGEIAWLGAFGVMHADTGGAVTQTTVFEAASLSKPVVAYAVLRLADRGEFDLDAPLWNTWEHERLTHDDRARIITARMVITHSSGLPNWGGTPLEFNFEPGAAWGYSGEGFVFLQRAVEAHTGLTLEEIAQREVFEPLGMPRSHFRWVPAYDSLAATPHDELGRATDKGRPDQGNAAASLHTTARDYARFLVAVMSGEGLAPETRAAMLTRQTNLRNAEWGDDEEAKRHLFWGLGWGIQHGSAGTAFWHWGDNGNMRCYVIAYPDTERGIVYFTNSQNGLSITPALVALVTEDEHWALRFLDYAAYDQPRRLARIRVRRAFLDGSAAGKTAFAEVKHDTPALLPEQDVNSLGYFLLRNDHIDDAIWVFRDNTRTFPESSNVWDSLGEAYMEAGHLNRAVEHYSTSVELDASNTNAKHRIAWMQLELDAQQNPMTLSPAELERLTGTFGPRTVSLRSGQLYYQREGSERPALPMRPLSADVFVIAELDDVRFRFVSDGDGNVVAIEGIYLDGRTDRNERDHR